MKELRGSEKQVKWAEDIRKDMLETLKEIEPVVKYLEEQKNSQNEKVINEFIETAQEIEDTITSKDEAKWFIDHKDNKDALTELTQVLSIPAKAAYPNSPAFDILENKVKNFKHLLKVYRHNNNIKSTSGVNR